MRKLNSRRKSWLITWALLGAHRNSIRNIRRKNYLDMKRGYVNIGSSDKRKITLYSNGNYREVLFHGVNKPVPSVLRLRVDAWDATIDFLNEAGLGLSSLINSSRKLRRKHASKKNTIKAYWDFSTITEISIPVALMLASEYDRIRELNGWVPKAVNMNSWDINVRNLLEAIGFLELAGVEDGIISVSNLPNGKILRMRRGKSADGQIIGDYIQELGVDLTAEDPRLHEAIMEAITNTVHHAYKNRELCRPFRLKAWWIAAQLIHAEGCRKLTVAIYDQGASIPRTLPTWDRYPMFKRLFLSVIGRDEENPNPEDMRYDGEAIRLAIQVGRTSTAESNRGKGLAQIIQALELSKGGSVHIFSRCGAWSQKFGEVGRSCTYDTPMVGTMIIWHLDL